MIFRLSPLLQNANANSLASMNAFDNLSDEQKWNSVQAAALPAINIAKAIMSYEDSSNAAWDAKGAAYLWIRHWNRLRADKNEKTATSVMTADAMISSLFPLFEQAKALSKVQVEEIKNRLVNEELEAISASLRPVEHIAKAIAACDPASPEASRMRDEALAWRRV
jgi:hypothetical protein